MSNRTGELMIHWIDMLIWCPGTMMRVGTAKFAKVNSKKVSSDRVKVPKYSKICGSLEHTWSICGSLGAKIGGDSLILIGFVGKN